MVYRWITTGPRRWFIGRILRQTLRGGSQVECQDGLQVEYYDRPTKMVHWQNITTSPPGQFIGRFFLQIVHRYNVTTGPPGQFMGRILRQALKDSSQAECYDRPSRIVHRQSCLDGSQVECYDSLQDSSQVESIFRLFIGTMLRQSLQYGSYVSFYDRPSRIVHSQHFTTCSPRWLIGKTLRHALQDSSWVECRMVYRWNFTTCLP